MCEPDDQEDNIVLAAILRRERYSYRTDILLVRKLNLLLQQLNLLLLRMDASNFNFILI